LSYASDYYNMLRQRYEEFRAAARDDQIAVMRYYAHGGPEIRIAHVYLYDEYGSLLIQGDDGRGPQPGNPCDVVVHPQSAQVVLRLLPREEAPVEAERRPIGFTAN
jgi:hypothetical protein